MELDEKLVAEERCDDRGQDGDELEAVGRHGGGHYRVRQRRGQAGEIADLIRTTPIYFPRAVR